MSRCLRWVLIAISVAAVTGSSPAQTSGTPSPEYKLRVGDVISVNVWGFKDFTLEQVPVRPDGKISFPTIGDIYVVDQTPAAVSRIITLGIKKYIADPKVVVTLLSSKADKYYVNGAVAKPGEFALSVNPPTGVREAVAAAGDLAPDANTQTATILRGAERLPVDLAAALRGDGSKNIMLQPGDTLSIEQALVTIEGAVTAPGQQPLRRGTTLTKALATAGGVKDTADMERVQVISGSETRMVNLRQLQKDMEEDPSKDLTLKPGDIIKVGLADTRTEPVLISGAVARPGTYRFVPGYRDTVQDAINLAGGLLGDVDLRRVKIRRGQDTNLTVDLRTESGRGEQLKPNDFIEIPKKRRSQAMNLATTAFGVIVTLYGAGLLRKR